MAARALDIAAGVSQVTTSPVDTAYIDQKSTVNAGGSISVTATGADQTSPPIDPSGAFNPSTSVDTQTGTITFPVNLSDGTAIQYQADPNTNTPIGGLDSDQIEFTGLIFEPKTTGDQILFPDGREWSSFGFEPGVSFSLTDASNPKDDGTYTVAAVDINVLTLTASQVLGSATNQTAAFMLNRAYRVMNPALTASGLIFANATTGNTITRLSGSWITDGFVTGEEITISGSNNAGTYSVTGVTGSTLTVANPSNAAYTVWAEAGKLATSITVTSQGAFRFGETFDASMVNVANDTITFAQPDDLQTGDAVMIDDEGNPAVGNINPSQTYFVRTVDAYSIQLCATLDDALATPDQVSPFDYNSSNSSFVLPILYENTLNEAGPFPITYTAPSPTTFYVSDVNATYDDQGNQSSDPNTIYVNTGNLKEGATVTYNFTGGDSPITNFSQGEQFGVHIKSTNAKSGTLNIQLYALNDPHKTPINLTLSTTAADQDASMTFTVQGFGPLQAMESGQSYTLVNGDTYLAVARIQTTWTATTSKLKTPRRGRSSPVSTPTPRCGALRQPRCLPAA